MPQGGGSRPPQADQGQLVPKDQAQLEIDALTHVFTYQQPDADQIAKMADIRAAALVFALCIRERVPRCADRTVAIRKIREAVMTANAAIMLDGLGVG
jgi:hypothetical protein